MLSRMSIFVRSGARGLHHAIADAKVELPALPYAIDALEPNYSKKTLEFHHGKHHAAYVNTTLTLIKGTPVEGKSVGEIVNWAEAQKNQGLFNQSAQIFNHSFFWSCMKPGGGGEPQGKLKEDINKTFGDYANFKATFVKAAAGVFGSGWVWLVRNNDGKLEIVPSSGAGTPLTSKTQKVLLTCDVWEHAYYLDYQNLRVKFVEVFFDKLVNWDFVAANDK